MVLVLFGVTVPATALAFLRPQIQSLILGGWDVHIACAPGSGMNELELIDELTVHPIAMARNPSPLRDLICLYRWHRLVRKLKPDIVVGSTPKAALLSMLAAKWNKTPKRLYHARGFRAEGLSGITKSIAILAERMTINLSSEVLVDSYSLKSALIKARCLSPERGVVLGSGSCCGVDTQFFRPPTPIEKIDARLGLNLNRDDVVVGFVGRIAHDKGVNELIQAFSYSKLRNPNLRLLLVGSDEGGIDGLHELTRDGGIRYLGSSNDVRSTYWAMDFFALPSYREGFPIAPLEAQACGLPLITTSATGCVDSQAPTNLHLIIPRKDSQSLARVIDFLAQDQKARLTAGMNARKWVEEDFDSSSVISRQNDFLRKLVNNP